MFLRDYLKVFLPLVAMLAIYRLVAVPLIEPTRAEVRAFGPANTDQLQTHWWSEHFVEGSWQRKQPKILETPQGIFLFENWDKLAPDRWKLHPLTIILPQSNDAGTSSQSTNPARRRVVLIETPQGAEIQFKEAIDWTSGQPPPVIGGQLNGKITLYSPPDETDSSDTGLRIDAADLRIDRRRIWTTKGITMRIGRSYVEGRDLSIYLDQDLLSSKQPNNAEIASPFKGLDHLELIYVDRVHVDLPPGGLFERRFESESTSLAQRPAHAEVRCRGSFRFDFHESNATLLSQVELRHLVEGAQPDTFQSDRLDLHFAWKSTTLGSGVTPSQEWTIDRMEAVGSSGIDPDDPTRWVQLEAPSIRARGRGRWMRVDMARGRIAMANHLPGQTSNEPAQVYLQRDSMQIWAPELEYEGERLRPSAATGAVGNEKSLGQLWAAGPGQASVVAEDGDAWKLSWARLLELKPEGDVDRLTIDGSANARSDRQGQFSAETVDVWLRSISPSLVDRVKRQSGGYEPSAVLPERLHASGTVIIRSPQLRTQVTDLQAWFHYPEVELARQSPAEPSQIPLELADNGSIVKQPGLNEASHGPTVASPLGTAFSNLVVMAEQTAPTSAPPATSPNTVGPGQLASSGMDVPRLGEPMRSIPVSLPTNVTGESLIAKFSQTSKGMKIDDLAITNNVTITRDQVSPSSPMPLTIIGHGLRMGSIEEGHMDVTVVGSPAKFAIGAGAMESAEIHFNQARKLVWMDQPGRFKLPPEAFKSMAAKSPPGAPNVPPHGGSIAIPGFIGQSSAAESDLNWIQQPEVQWQGRMVFDGRTARMDGGVRLTGRVASQGEVVWHLDGRARQLNVELEEPIDFGGESGSKAGIATIRLVDDVDLKAAQTDLQGIRRSLEHLEVPELTFYVPQQKWLGIGPGSLRTKRIGNATPDSPEAILNGVPTTAPSTQKKNPKAELQCVHLRFGGRMEGDMVKQQVHFYDRVEVLLQPILSWDELPDVRLIDTPKIGQTMMTCDSMRLENSSNLSWTRTQIEDRQLRRDAAWEITGEGHVRVDSVTEKESFSVITPGGIQYVALYSLLRIYGNGAEAAEVRRRTLAASPEQNAGVALISNGAINLKTGESNIQFRSVSGNLATPPGTEPYRSESTPTIGSPRSGYGVPTPNSPSITSPRDTQPMFPRRTP